VSCLQIADFSGRALSFDTQQPREGRLECKGVRALRHLGELLCVIKPAVDSADDILFGGDPVREERLQERVAVDRSVAARASATGIAGGPVWSPARGGRARRR